MKFNDNLFLVPWMQDLGLGDRYEQVLGQVAAQLAQEEGLELERIEFEQGTALERSAPHFRGTVDHDRNATTRGKAMDGRTTQHDWIARMTQLSGGDIGTLPGTPRRPPTR